MEALKASLAAKGAAAAEEKPARSSRKATGTEG
jgi:hypothetical protein